MSAALRPLHWSFLGRIPYAEAVELQHAVRAEVKAGTGPEHLLLLEHPHVYTLGRNAVERDVLAPAEWLEAKGVEVSQTNRGGQVTYHGPGQLVGYPILDLSPDRRDVRRYVQDLQEVLIRSLAEVGVAAHPRDGQEHIGVWVGEEKIASIGVHLSRWVTTHGFALNLGTDLSMFGGIVPCGLQQVRMTSVERLTGDAPDLSQMARIVARQLSQRFDRRPVEAAPAAALAGAAP
jgi:lipoyl(octanoyl) transferase